MQFELLKTFAHEGPLTVVVNGDCMQETIPGGSRLRLESRPGYWPGDVIAFKRGDGKIVSHRFLGYVPGRSGWRVVTCAENTRRVDAPVLVQEVLGKVILVDGQSFHPAIRHRARAVTRYFAAVIRLIVEKIGTYRSRGNDGQQ